MYWPNSPFDENRELYERLRSDFVNEESISELGFESCESRLCALMKQLCFPPSFTTVRLNMGVQPEQALNEVLCCTSKNGILQNVSLHPILPDLLSIRSYRPFPDFGVVPRGKEVVVGLQCGEAVLRGAPVFAAGVLGAPNGLCPGDDVCVYADLDGKCLRGSKKQFTGRKVFVGNGKATVSRDFLFKTSQARGVAIDVIEPVCDCPPSALLHVGTLHNLPSVVCARVLGPRPFDWVIDMCAAPGGKTTHIGTLMNDEGVLVALDKTSSRVEKLKETVAASNLTCVHCFCFDSTKCIDKTKTPSDSDEMRLSTSSRERSEEFLSPPYPPELFDRVLLDAPCSGLGRRPQLANRMTVKEMSSFPPLQKKLFSAAVSLLRIGGTLVYSTCTLTLAENEGLVKWALQEFHELELQDQVPHIGGPGMAGAHLSPSTRLKLQRFEALSGENSCTSVDSDTIAFFIAKFVKKSSSKCV